MRYAIYPTGKTVAFIVLVDIPIYFYKYLLQDIFRIFVGYIGCTSYIPHKLVLVGIYDFAESLWIFRNPLDQISIVHGRKE